jgi:ClpP class serine protease
MKRYALRAGEPLAISSDAVRHDADGFFMLLGGDPPENETHGSVICVKVRGALQQFKGPEGDSYEGISERVAAAFGADPKPSAVLLRISSPGGLVAGLNECILKLQRMAKAAGIPLVAYADELAASAAYALCCACSEILAPPSGIVGSVGVISTMVSIAKRDEKDGVEFRLITSGKRKADGHLHMPISDDAVRAEMARNAEMASQFFAIASKARGIAPKKLEGLEAAIYLGKAAKAVGLIDDVIGLEDALLGLSTSEVRAEVAVGPNNGKVTDRRAERAAKSAQSARNGTPLDKVSRVVAHHSPAGDRPMPVKLDALIKKTEAAISATVDPKKLRALQANLAAFAATRAELDGDDDSDDEDDDKKKDDDDSDDDADEESKAKKAAESARKAKAKAESAKHRAKAAEHKQKAAESEELADKADADADGGEEEEEEEEEEARLRVAPVSAGIHTAALDGLSARIDRIERDTVRRNTDARIEQALARRVISPKQAADLRKGTAAEVSAFLKYAKTPLVPADHEESLAPDARANADLPALVTKEVERAVSASGLSGDDAEKLRTELLTEHRKARANGAGTRY